MPQSWREALHTRSRSVHYEHDVRSLRLAVPTPRMKVSVPMYSGHGGARLHRAPSNPRSTPCPNSITSPRKAAISCSAARTAWKGLEGPGASQGSRDRGRASQACYGGERKRTSARYIGDVHPSFVCSLSPVNVGHYGMLIENTHI